MRKKTHRPLSKRDLLGSFCLGVKLKNKAIIKSGMKKARFFFEATAEA
jgi:hypothetical protein